MAQQFVNRMINVSGSTMNRTPSTESGSIFLKRFEQIKEEVPFSPNWANGTGYYDGALSSVNLNPGEIKKSYDPKTDRLLILIGCRKGNLVVHERYSGGKEGVYVKTSNNPLLELVGIPTGAIGLQSMIRLLGDWEPSENIGVQMEELTEELKGERT